MEYLTIVKKNTATLIGKNEMKTNISFIIYTANPAKSSKI